MRFIVVGFLCWALSGQASELVRLTMSLDLSYEDSSLSCKTIRPGPELQVVAERSGDVLAKVVFSNYPRIWPFTHIYKEFALTSSEARQVELHRDPEGRYWIKRLLLSESQWSWILYTITRRATSCVLPQPLLTLSPSPDSLSFEMDGVDSGILLSYSQKLGMRGTLKDGKAYEATSRLIQKQRTVPEELIPGLFN